MDINNYITKLCNGDKQSLAKLHSNLDVYFNDFIKSPGFNVFSKTLDEIDDDEILNEAYKYYLISIDMYFKNQLSCGLNNNPEIPFIDYFPNIIVRALRDKHTSNERKVIINKKIQKKIVDNKMKEMFGGK